MWNNTRRGRNIIRQRRISKSTRNFVKSSLKYVVPPFVILIVLVAVFIGRINNTSINNEVAKKEEVIETNNKLDIEIYKEVEIATKDEPKENIQIYEDVKEGIKEEIESLTNIDEEDKEEITFTALGEIMMGGNVKTSDSGSYTLAFSDVSEFTRNSDYVVSNFTTNITSLEEIENPKTKYIVTDKILNAFNALNINAVNIANDHALDFGNSVFERTKDALLNADLDVIGLKDEIVYAEKNGIKIAFIGVCNEVIGMQYYYTKAGILMYDIDLVKEKIKEAKEKADMVVVMNHLGLENTYKVTSIMSWYYKLLIDSGADMVLGSHALGIYPIEIYKGKPIIYSLGYFMHDTEIEIGKESGIFNFTLDKNGTLKEISIIPTYIKNKEKVVPYYSYDKEKAEALLNKVGENISKENKQIIDNKLIIIID